ncbi:MAG: tetratricopeptide repeat protein, partial [Planctomycetes bacterium]|nr:tetratricopeptide repeat protein [Planctomycetota bacterium]
MKTLALFAIICLGLLAFAAWHLKSVTGGLALEGESPPRALQESSPGAVDEEIKPSEVPGADGVATADELPEHAEDEPDSLPTAIRLTTAGEPRATSPVTQSTVRWAGDQEPRRARQRFIELRSTLTDDPHNEAALEAALELARQLDWHNEACDLLARLVRLRPEDAALRLELAVQLMRLERWLEAVPQLRFVVEQQPDNERAWYNLAIAHQALGHLRDARATWSRVLELMPENPDAYAHRGEVLLDLRAWQEAAAD